MKENKKHKKDDHREDPVEQVEQQETPTTDEETAAPEPKGEEESKVDDLLDNLLPVTLGNIVGGALFVGVLYGWIYGRRQR